MRHLVPTRVYIAWKILTIRKLHMSHGWSGKKWHATVSEYRR